LTDLLPGKRAVRCELGVCSDTEEVQVAKREFLREFDRAMTGLLVELAPNPVRAQVTHRT
jgi:hypothetical protein